MFRDNQKLRRTQYKPKSFHRAARALSCSPFTLKLFKEMRNRSISLSTISSIHGKNDKYTIKEIVENEVESYLLWLINTGVLRREVDGQGLTDSFRLTPLGREIISSWEAENDIPKLSWLDKLKNWCSRWLGITI